MSISKTKEQIAPDWTTDPETGRCNSSPKFLHLVSEVDRLIRGQSHALLNGHCHFVASLIVAQLAHVHDVGPRKALANSHTALLEAVREALRLIINNNDRGNAAYIRLEAALKQAEN